MKKILLSSFVIITFIAYSMHNFFDEDNKPVIAPKKITDNSASPTPTHTPTPTVPSTTSNKTTIPTSPVLPTATPVPSSPYKDGTYTGDVADAFYGNVQIQITISSGKISNVQFLQYPNDRNHSIEVNSQAMPYLIQEAIQAQSANVDVISGATATSQAFVQSMQSALNKAKS